MPKKIPVTGPVFKTSIFRNLTWEAVANQKISRPFLRKKIRGDPALVGEGSFFLAPRQQPAGRDQVDDDNFSTIRMRRNVPPSVPPHEGGIKGGCHCLVIIPPLRGDLALMERDLSKQLQ